MDAPAVRWNLGLCPHGGQAGTPCEYCDDLHIRLWTLPNIQKRLSSVMDFYDAHPHLGVGMKHLLALLEVELSVLRNTPQMGQDKQEQQKIKKQREREASKLRVRRFRERQRERAGNTAH